jgi:phenylalanyl-tRNA synthetase beta chain
MKFSVNWISEFTGPLDISPRELAALITIKTAEQEGVEEVGGHWLSVCAAKINSVKPIRGSSNVEVEVDTGRYGIRTVVCGAPNCHPGLVTAYVPPGCQLGAKTITTTTISGVVSDGMLASGAELGVNRDHEGILEIGAQPGNLLPGCVPDALIEIDNKSLTHRPDLWGHFGMAREVAAITSRPLTDPVRLDRLPAGPPPLEIVIEDLDLCPRYCALVFENVTVMPSPLWLQQRLESVGVNPINNIVDVTNYVMAELAQPMHAFDRDKVHGGTIYVRRARAGERVIALDNQAYELDPQTLVIADANGPEAIAGVIGGLSSGVTSTTHRIVLESANFHPGWVRKTSSRLRLRTDASMRFEKAQDPANTTRALARAIDLLEIVSPGIRLLGGLAGAGAAPAAARVIDLPIDWLRRKLGRSVETTEVEAILRSLQFSVASTGSGSLSVTVPSWRATKDISIKDDLVEEVGRMLGYGSIPPAPPVGPAIRPAANPEREYFHSLRATCTGQGFTEVYNYSFVSEEQVSEIGGDPSSHVKVTNPIASDQSLLRNSLTVGILRNVRDNCRNFETFRLFEIGQAIHRVQGSPPREIPNLAACVYAKSGDGVAGLQEVKRLVQCLLPGARVKLAECRPFEHPVRSWEVVWKGETLGRIGEFHPSLVNGRAAFASIDLESVQRIGFAPVSYRRLQRFPTSAFDLSIVVGLRVQVGDLELELASKSGMLVQSVEFVRQYIGAPLPGDRKSVSFRVTIGASDRTLSAQEITAERAHLIASMQAAGFELRV